MNKNRSQREYMPSLGLSNKDYIHSDISITNTSATSTNDKVIALPLENETCTVLYADLWFKKARFVNKVDVDL